MHITILALGTRGDVQPMIALGKGLKSAGHSVHLIGGENFADWIRGHGLECTTTVDIQALVQSEAGVAMLESGQNMLKLMNTMKQLMRQYRDVILAPLQAAAQHSDLMLSGFGGDSFAQTLSEKFGVRQISAPLQPYYPTRSGATTMQTIAPHSETVINKWIGGFIESMAWTMSGETTNYMRQQLGLKPHTSRSYSRIAHTIPTVYGFSRHIVPPPPDWPDHVHVTGYWFLDHEPDFQPPEALTQFLAAGTAPIYVGFGSMANSDPAQTFSIVSEALAQAGQRGIVGKGWSGVKAESFPEHIHALDNIPHSWLFPRMAGVVHHGGAGTTAAGLQAGVPSLLIPHGTDQPFWARRLHDLGLSPKPIPRNKLALDRLMQGMKALVTDNAMRDQARAMGQKIRAERGVETAVELIERYMAR
jgi:sterol 3beta-glucosyltransferase